MQKAQIVSFSFCVAFVCVCMTTATVKIKQQATHSYQGH